MTPEQTPRGRVFASLDHELRGRVPRHLWTLPWAETHHADALARLERRYPSDIAGAPRCLRAPLRVTGDQHGVGRYVDEWGAQFESIQAGVIGEVKRPAIRDWDDLAGVRFPEELLSVDVDAVNRFCASTDRFVLAPCVARPFERLQFLRGSQDLFVDLLLRPAGMMELVRAMHAFYVREMQLWASTAVDALFFMDDWGGQSSMLVSPALWRELFKPMYRDYIRVAHAAGKRAFMHSDGWILPVIPDLVELGLDALNSQVFCMGVEELAPYRGRLTFWGEIDRQHLLARAGIAEVAAAVGRVKDALYDRGGVIAQCEFGIGARPANVAAVFAEWDRLTG
jgi:uroporphyrinogen decarboxylase